MSTGTNSPSLVVTPSELGEYIKYKRCPRYAKLRNDGEAEEEAREWKEAFKTLNPMLSEEGQRFEEGVYEDVRPLAYDTIESWRDYDAQEENNETLRQAVLDTAKRDAGEAPLLLMQAHFAGEIGSFFVPGDSDLITLWPQDGNNVRIRIFDIKSSFEEKTYHQIQTACYTILYEQVLDHPDVRDAGVEVEIDAGIIYRESDWSALDPDVLPRFEPEPREADVRRLLQEDGELARVIHADLDDIDYQLDSACQTCPYNESCFTRSIEGNDIRLLGLTRGEQAAFRKHGLETLDDIAKLIEPVEDPKPYEYGDPEIRDQYKDAVADIAENHSIGERLPRLAQKAQALLGELNPDHPDAHDAPWLPWIKGSGDGNLPEDDPPYDADMPIQRGSLIRVYLNVQWDYLRDRIAVFSGRVTCGNYDGTPLTFSTMMGEKGVSEDEDEQAEDEEELLREGFERMFEAIKTVAGLTGQPEEAPVHLYFYSKGERDSLMDAVKRHPSLTRAEAVRDLLGLRSGIDQAMVSVVQDEVEQRLALKHISTGLLPTMGNFHPSEDHAPFEFSDWTYDRDDGTTVNLRSAFYHKLFDYSVPYKRDGNSIELLLEGQNQDNDGWYPSRGRFGAEIPLEYIWAAKGIDEFGPDWTDNPQYQGIIEMFRWRDHNEKNDRITTEDVEALSRKFAHALHHVERGIKFKNSDIHKEPLELPELDEFSLGEADLAQACKEYLDLEYATTKQDMLSLYRQPVKDRIMNGQSLPVEIEDCTLNDGFLSATGTLIVDEFDFADPGRVAMATRLKGSDEGTSGSWMLATPLRELSDGSLVQSVGKPDQIQNSAPVTIQKLDPRTGEVELQAFPNGGKKDDDYRTWHKRWTTDEGSSDTFIAPGERFILDPQSDDMTAERAGNALDHADRSALYELTQSIADGSVTAPTTDAFDADALDEYVEWCQSDADPSPNDEQREFIGEGDAQVSLLQGPPGTGKTSGALSHALLARAYAKNAADEHLRAIVTGASNKAVDELMDDVAENLRQFRDTHASEALDDVMLVRFVGDKPANPLPEVTYINYHEDEDEMQRLEQRLQPPAMRQTTLSQATTDAQPHVIVFSTPSRVAGYMGKHSMFGYPNDPYEMAPNIFDCFAMDEASMLPLPQFLLAGAFVTEDSQLLIGGDQRQMPPVQKHDWDLEDRRTVEQVAPFLSTLDYFRLLRGDAVDGVEDEVIEQSPNADIPIARLKETYRCHTTVAAFLRKWVYSQDDIDYQSDRTYTIPAAQGDTPGLDAAIDNERPLTLILHDDAASQQSNISEAKMAQKLVENLPDSETLGIVTPHNSQKGLLSAMCDPRAHVDTVERFQGGQRDCMMLSATVSDPDYLDAESDFILNPNRLNVALSRMKKKLIVIAPKTLFNVLPGDTDAYDDSTIWKGLYRECGADGDAEWSGSLAEFTGDDRDGDDVTVSVYSK